MGGYRSAARIWESLGSCVLQAVLWTATVVVLFGCEDDDSVVGGGGSE